VVEGLVPRALAGTCHTWSYLSLTRPCIAIFSFSGLTCRATLRSDRHSNKLQKDVLQ